MNTDQKKKVFEIVKDEVGSDAKLIAQVGALDLKIFSFSKSSSNCCIDKLTPVNAGIE